MNNSLDTNELILHILKQLDGKGIQELNDLSLHAVCTVLTNEYTNLEMELKRTKRKIKQKEQEEDSTLSIEMLEHIKLFNSRFAYNALTGTISYKKRVGNKARGSVLATSSVSVCLGGVLVNLKRLLYSINTGKEVRAVSVLNGDIHDKSASNLVPYK